MTVFAKNITYGLETTIKECQEYLNSELSNYWGGDLEVFGIVSKKERDNLIVPEAWIGLGSGNKEYLEVFINDKIGASIGFLVNSRELIPYKTANIDVVFTINLPIIYPTSITRDKEKALLQAEKTLESFINIDQAISIKEGIEEVFSGFDTNRIKHRDMHPWYVFSINANFQYTDDSCQ